MAVLYYILLAPLSLLYRLAVSVRNSFFNTGIWRPFVAPVPVISIGNITAGGTGKTPHIEFFTAKFQSSYHVAVLSRGYKRKTRGFILANQQSTALEIGDEPCQIKQHFPAITVAVDANRTNGIKKILTHRPETNLILLDDAFQHRRVKPHCSIVLIDYRRPVHLDRLLPWGHLREPISQLSRADIVIITKATQSITEKQRETFVSNLPLAGHQPVFWTTFRYDTVLVSPFNGHRIFITDLAKYAVLLVCGIADPSDLIRFLAAQSAHLKTLVFPDHHFYRPADLKKISAVWNAITTKQKIILTTTKDATRLTDLDKQLQSSLYCISVQVHVLEPGEEALLAAVQEKMYQ